MEKTFTISVIGISAVVLFSACTKNEVISITDTPQTISYIPLSGKLSTKAMLDGTTYKSTDPSFGVFGYYLPAGSDWNTKHGAATLYVPKSEVMNNGQSTGNAWTTATPYYWPKTGAITFFAYSPYKYQETGGNEIPVSLTGTGLVIGNHTPDEYDVDAHQETDLLVADVQKDVHGNNSNPGNYNGVPVIFRHKLSQIVNLSFSTIDKNGTPKDYANGHDGSASNPYQAGDVVFELVKVSLNNLATRGIYSYDAQTTVHEGWTTNSSDGVKNYIWYDATDGTPDRFNDAALSFDFNDKYTANAHDYLLVLPQPLQNTGSIAVSTTPYFDIRYKVRTYTDATHASDETVDAIVNLHALHGAASENLEMNKKISYGFKVCLEEQQIYWAPSIVDWESQGFEKQF